MNVNMCFVLSGLIRLSVIKDKDDRVLEQVEICSKKINLSVKI